MKLEKLGFGVVKMGTKLEARAHKEFFKKFERALKRLIKWSWTISMDERIKRLNWVSSKNNINYFRIEKMKKI